MIVLTSVVEHIGRLVHADARVSEAVNARHRAFLAMHLGMFALALAVAPLALAGGHVPAAWEACAAAWLTIPLGASAYVSRTGRLVPAERACLLGWAGFALTTTLGGGLSGGGGVLLLLLLPLQAASRDDHALVGTSLRIAAAGGLVLCAAALLGLASFTAPSHALDALVVGPALVYAGGLLLASVARRTELQRRQAAGDQRYEVLAAATGDLILHYDRSAGVLSASRHAEPMFGTSPRSLLGRGFFERVHVADRPAFLKMFSDAAESGNNACARLRFKIGGEAVEGRVEPPAFAWIEVRARRCEQGARQDGLAAGARGTVLALVRDISAQKQHEIAMERAREEAERASAWKDSFLANVSHELRTPLNAIIGFSEMLSSEEFSPREPAKQREYASIITTSGHHLLSVVNSLLDMSKIEAGRFEINPEPFGLAGLIASCCEMVGLKAEQAGIDIQSRLDPTLADIVGDKRACKQIVINLLSNALKFTPRGGQVTIGARPHGNSVLVTVADTGIGISPRDLGRLGDAFFQGQSGYDKPYEGTGLGLSVVRGLVGLHGGSIAVESALGEGTRVVVQLPLDCRSVASSSGSARIDVIPRYSRPPIVTDKPKVQKIA